MKKLTFFFTLMLFCVVALQTKAQNANSSGNLNFAHVEVEEYAPNQAYISMKIVGKLAVDVTEVYYSIKGDRIPGGEITMLLDQSRYLDPDPEWLVNFSILPKTSTGNGGQEDQVEIEVWSNAGPLKPRDRIHRRFKRPIYSPCNGC